MLFGPDVSSIKGMVTKNLPMLVMSNYIRIAKELINNPHEVTLCIGTIHLNGLVFLLQYQDKLCIGQLNSFKIKVYEGTKVYWIQYSGITIKKSSE
jgi:hypothetical protein